MADLCKAGRHEAIYWPRMISNNVSFVILHLPHGGVRARDAYPPRRVRAKRDDTGAIYRLIVTQQSTIDSE